MTWRSGPDVPSMTWRGGADVPSMTLGRMNATSPFASLRLSHSGLVLTVVRKRFFLTPADVAAVYPCVRSPLAKGIGIEARDGQVLIFWTAEGHAVLSALQVAGFPISFQPRKAAEEIRAARRRVGPIGSARRRFALRGVFFLAGLLYCVLMKPVLAPDTSWATVLLLPLAGIAFYALLSLRPK
ncbi:hypothetical protein amrb99_52180 [Actinomadura sp. RB99]|nr:hypothetical protein [Actinomadura sp. RB99]